MIAIIIILVVYVLPFAAMFIWVKMAHSEGGVEDVEQFDMTYFWVMICPMLNIVGAFLLWFDEHPKTGGRKIKDYLKDLVVKKIFKL